MTQVSLFDCWDGALISYCSCTPTLYNRCPAKFNALFNYYHSLSCTFFFFNKYFLLRELKKALESIFNAFLISHFKLRIWFEKQIIFVKGKKYFN